MRSSNCSSNKASDISKTGAYALIKSLEANGIRYIFGYPGASNLDIYNALYLSKKIKHVLVRHEQAAVHAADGYARSSNKVGCVLVTSGPGICNTISGIASAYLDSVPLLVISGQVSSKLLASDAFQEVDSTGITMPIVKHSFLVRDVNKIPATIDTALFIAETGRPGPVLIDIPCDVATSIIDANKLKNSNRINLAGYNPQTPLKASSIRKSCAILAESKKPIIIAGGGVKISEAQTWLVRLAKKCNAPVVTTMNAKGIIESNNPYYLGMLGTYGSAAANVAFNEADFVLAIGTRLTERTLDFDDICLKSKSFVHIDKDAAELSKNINCKVEILADAKEAVKALSDTISKMDDYNGASKEWQERFIEIKQYAQEHLNDSYELTSLQKNTNAIKMQDVFNVLNSIINKPKSAAQYLVTTDVGQHQLAAAKFLEIAEPTHYISSTGLGTMGFGLPAAMGAKIANPSKKVICVTGDGSFQMTFPELATLVENKIEVKIILFNNNALGLVKQIQELKFAKHCIATDFSKNPDFCQLANAYGVKTFSVDNAKDLKTTIQKFLKCAGTSLLEVKISNNSTILPTSKVLEESDVF
ncbi:MAG: biosynthetic-type acetolactate synthase large subunit [Coriobacteriales bacterium]|nr:biosynthetic-type acetolactate synthase large subunit [Coriobacteriales bacterium]